MNRRKYDFMCFLMVLILGVLLLVPVSVGATGKYVVTSDGVCTYTAGSERSSACDRMIEMATVEWSIPKQKSLKYKYTAKSYITLNAGKYRGLPYTQVNRGFSNPNASVVQSRIDKAIKGTDEVKGVDCSSAASFALRYGTKNNSDNSTFLKSKNGMYVSSCFLYDAMTASSGETKNGYLYRNDLTYVGSYGSYTAYKTAGYTDKILTALESGRYYSYGDVYSNVYAKIRPGDVMVRSNSDTSKGAGHVELVTGVKIVHKNGKIDANASKLIITDQISPNVTSTGTYKSSWRVNREFSFQKLESVGFLPVTLNQWKETYQIKYDLNGGTGTVTNQQKKQYQAINLRTSIPYKAGYTFIGWKTGNTVYQPGERYDEEQSMTLSAIWKKQEDTSDGKQDPETPASFVRIAGDTRYETALKTANALKKSMDMKSFDSIIVADGNNYPDALAGSYLAKVKKAPLILVDRSVTSEKMIGEYIKKNLSDKGTVYLLGGSDVVTERFEKSLKGIDVKRLAGDTRYETNLEILNEAKVSKEDLLACTGEGFADSLSASAVGKPILLVDNRGLTKAQKTYLDKANVQDIYLIGGADVVSDKVGKELKSYDKDSKTERIAGDNRYKTSVAVAKAFFPDKCDTAVLAYGMKFPDGLAGGPLAISMGSPLLLVEDTAYADAKTYAQKAGIKKLAVLGGTDVIADKTANMIVK